MNKDEWLKFFDINFQYISNIIEKKFPEYFYQITIARSVKNVSKMYHYISESKNLLSNKELNDAELLVFDKLLETKPDTNFYI